MCRWLITVFWGLRKGKRAFLSRPLTITMSGEATAHTKEPKLKDCRRLFMCMCVPFVEKVCVCVCERERERERKLACIYECVYSYECLCVCESLCVCVCLCV